jgi:hypothetical protein
MKKDIIEIDVLEIELTNAAEISFANSSWLENAGKYKMSTHKTFTVSIYEKQNAGY